MDGWMEQRMIYKKNDRKNKITLDRMKEQKTEQ